VEEKTNAFSHILWQVGDVKVGGFIITFSLETRIKGLLQNVSRRRDDSGKENYSGETNFIAKLVETTNAKLRITNTKILCEAEARRKLVKTIEGLEGDTYPLQAPVEVSMMALEVSTFPKRAAKAARVSSSVFGCRPRM
jgi:hypothetical protein